MKTNLPALLLTLILSILVSTSQAAESGRLDLNPLASSMTASPKVNINFGSAMMLGFAETMRHSNPDLADILGGVSGLRLMVFETSGVWNAEPQVLDIIDRLGRDGWTPAITIEDEETRINILMLESGEYVTGLTLLLRDGDDTAIFANIHGQLDPVIIGQLIGGGKAMQDLGLGELIGQFQGGK